MSSTALQVIIGVQLFALGVIAALTARHAVAYFKSDKHDAEYRPPLLPSHDLSPEAKEKLIEHSQKEYETVIRHSAAELQHDLHLSADQINALIKRFAMDIVENEMQRYRTELKQIHGTAGSEMEAMKAEVAKERAELTAKMNEEIAAEKQKLIKQIDTKLSDAVGSFLIETLGHNVDLGSQSSYLVEMLEKHKQEFSKEVDGGSNPPS